MFIDFALLMMLAILAIPSICGYYAHSRGRSFWLWFFIGCFLPVISYFILILLPDKRNPIEQSLEDLRVKYKMLGVSPDIPTADPLRSAIERTAISHIDFEPILNSSPKQLKVLIDGKPLEQLLYHSELPYAKEENHPEWAGAYSGIPLSLALPPYKHLLGEPSKKFNVDSRPVILKGTEVIPESMRHLWLWTVNISFYRRVVVWHHARQEARIGKWLYYKPELWVFNKLQYEEALRKLEKCIS